MRREDPDSEQINVAVIWLYIFPVSFRASGLNANVTCMSYEDRKEVDVKFNETMSSIPLRLN